MMRLMYRQCPECPNTHILYAIDFIEHMEIEHGYGFGLAETALRSATEKRKSSDDDWRRVDKCQYA